MSKWSAAACDAWIVGALVLGFFIIGAGVVLGADHRWRHIARLVIGASGIVAIVGSLWGLHDPLASMTDYTLGLMLLGQVAPPLLIAGLPPEMWSYLRGAHGGQQAISALRWCFDPWVCGAVFILLSVAVSVPSILNRSLANAIFSAPLGLFELIAGMMFWFQICRSTRSLRFDISSGVFALAGTVPMTVVSVIWMVSPTVLYAPYLDVICRWDLTPLQDQHWSGLVMLIAGLPLQIAGAWRLVV